MFLRLLWAQRHSPYIPCHVRHDEGTQQLYVADVQWSICMWDSGVIKMAPNAEYLTHVASRLPENERLRGVDALLLPFCGQKIAQLAHVGFAELATQRFAP